MHWSWLGSRKTRGDEKKIKLWSRWLLTRVKSHYLLLRHFSGNKKQRKWVLNWTPTPWNQLCFSHFAYPLAQTSLKTPATALCCICLFSARPPINDPAKLSSHRSQAALIHHYSGSISCIAVSFPVGWAGEEMSRDKQLCSQIPSGEEGMRTAVVEKKRGALKMTGKEEKGNDSWAGEQQHFSCVCLRRK